MTWRLVESSAILTYLATADSQGEGDRGKGGARKEEEERKKVEQAAKRAELKRLQEEEDAALSATKAKQAPAGTQKVITSIYLHKW